MTAPCISLLRPRADESLMSYLRRAQDDAGYSEDGFVAVVAGAAMPDSRQAERRSFDWDSLGRYFNASAEELFELSERSLFYGKEEANRGALLVRRAPWIQTAGYSAHCPCCLNESPHWRKSWLRPGAIMCAEHGTVLVRHCYSCGGDLGGMNWTRPAPVCPTCSAHLSFSPVIEAPGGMAYRAEVIRNETSALFRNTPVNWNARELTRAAVVWRAAQALNTKPQFMDLCSLFCGSADLGAYDTQTTATGLAMRYAQSYIVAHFLTELNPGLLEHYSLANGNSAERKLADNAVLLELSEIAEAFYLQQAQVKAEGQRMLSFAPCDGECSISMTTDFRQLTRSVASCAGQKVVPTAA